MTDQSTLYEQEIRKIVRKFLSDKLDSPNSNISIAIENLFFEFGCEMGKWGLAEAQKIYNDTHK